MIIKVFGQHWNPDIIDWGSVGAGNRGSLPGKTKVRGTMHVIDYWEAVGVYVLQHNFETVYVGKAVATRMGPRLRDHLSDRLAGRWDMFSWFSICDCNVTTGVVGSAPMKRPVSCDNMVNTLEAISILITDPPLNRRVEKFAGAKEAVQPKGMPRTIRAYLNHFSSQLDDIQKAVDDL